MAMLGTVNPLYDYRFNSELKHKWLSTANKPPVDFDALTCAIELSEYMPYAIGVYVCTCSVHCIRSIVGGCAWWCEHGVVVY